MKREMDGLRHHTSVMGVGEMLAETRRTQTQESGSCDADTAVEFGKRIGEMSAEPQVK